MSGGIKSVTGIEQWDLAASGEDGSTPMLLRDAGQSEKSLAQMAVSYD